MRTLLISILLLLHSGLYSQSNFKNYSLILKASPIYGYHPNKPVPFPIGYTDAFLFPLNQDYHIGFDVSADILYQLNKHFQIGVTTYISRFGFTESGEELNFWSGKTSNYTIDRQFTLHGIGIQTGYHILKNDLNKLTLNMGVTFERLISSRQIYLWREEENNPKYSFNSSIDYSHKLTHKFDILIGLNSRIGLKEYFSSIAYKPSRLGVNIGLAYSL
jgi:hypothetical protein